MKIAPGIQLFIGFVTTLLTGVPLFCRTIDLWDGVILSYASESGNFVGYNKLAFDSGWELSYYLNLAIAKFCSILKMSFLDVSALFVVILLFFISREIFVYCLIFFGIESKFALFSSVFFLTFPTWHVLHSTIFNHFVFSLFCGMIGLRLIFTGTKLVKCFGYFLVLIGYQLPSLLSFLPVLALTIWISQTSRSRNLANTELKSIELKIKPTEIAKISILGICFYLLDQIVFNPPSGNYLNYNNLNFQNILLLKHSAMLYIGKGIVSYGTFFVFTLIFVVLALTMVLLRSKVDLISRNRMNRVQQRSFIATSNLDARSVLVELGSMALLSISAVLPYLVVGKNSSIRGIDWGSRHAIVFSTAVSFCTGLLVQRLSKSLKTIGLQNRIVMIFASMVILAPNASILIYGHFLNISQEHRVTKLISTIKPYSNAFTPGKIAVISDAFRRPLSFYESNYVLYKVTGNLNHYGYVGPKSGMREGLDIPEKLLRRQPAEVYLTTLKSNTMSKCIKIFEVNKGQKVIVKKECI